jgi:hypothetical protein
MSPSSKSPVHSGGAANVFAEWTQLLPVAGEALETASVVASRRTLMKIVRKHVGDPAEPWRRWLPDGLLNALSDFARSGGTVCPDELLAELAGVIGEWAAGAADRPRLLRCRQQDGDVAASRRWSVLHVARCGAYVVIDIGVPVGRQKTATNVLKTCFFATPHPADHPPGNAWRTMAQRVIWRWSSYDGRCGAFRIRPDSDQRVVPQETGDSSLRWHPRFISAESWGIRELPDGGRGFRSLPGGTW